MIGTGSEKGSANAWRGLKALSWAFATNIGGIWGTAELVNRTESPR